GAPVALGTIWELSDELWERIEPVLERRYPRRRRGRPRADLRRVLDAIIYRMRTGAQWQALPRELGASSTVHDWFQRFAEDGALQEIWAVLAGECDELGAVAWEWQAAEGVSEDLCRHERMERSCRPRTTAARSRSRSTGAATSSDEASPKGEVRLMTSRAAGAPGVAAGDGISSMTRSTGSARACRSASCPTMSAASSPTG
ncbi:MAG: transposase, partial [Solirubrobacteraceae bacterium]